MAGDIMPGRCHYRRDIESQMVHCEPDVQRDFRQQEIKMFLVSKTLSYTIRGSFSLCKVYKPLNISYVHEVISISV